MKIAVVNGSPKGKYSITLQTVRYLERRFPEHEFTVLHAGQTIRALERDFSSAREVLSSFVISASCCITPRIASPTRREASTDLCCEVLSSLQGFWAKDAVVISSVSISMMQRRIAYLKNL